MLDFKVMLNNLWCFFFLYNRNNLVYFKAIVSYKHPFFWCFVFVNYANLYLTKSISITIWLFWTKCHVYKYTQFLIKGVLSKSLNQVSMHTDVCMLNWEATASCQTIFDSQMKTIKFYRKMHKILWFVKQC